MDKDLPEINVNDLPKCSKCGKLARPHIVWFGEHLDAKILQKTSMYICFKIYNVIIIMSFNYFGIINSYQQHIYMGRAFAVKFLYFVIYPISKLRM